MAAKSSSGAALLLLAAVLLAGTCTSPAHAVAGPEQVDLVNLCAYDAVVYAGRVATDIVVPAGETLVPVDLDFLRNIVAPVYIYINGKFYLWDLGSLEGNLGLPEGTLGATGVEVKIEIVCNGACGENVITILVYVQPIQLIGVEIGEPTVLGPFCLDLIINP